MNILTRPCRNVLKPTLLVSSVALAIALAGCHSGGGGAGGSSSGGSGDVVANVNGTPITRDSLDQYLEASGGDQAVRQLVSFELVMQEAKKDNLDVTDADVDALIAERRKTSPALAQQIDELTKTGGPRLDALKRQIRYQLAVQKLITKDVKVDDAALQKWFDANKATYETPASVKISVLVTSTKTRADTMAQQLKSKTKTFPQLIDEQQKANDPAGKSSAADKETPLKGLPPTLQAVVNKLKVGDISDAITIVPNVFGVIRLESKVDAKSPTLAEIRPEAERDYKQEQLARQTVAKNPQNPNFDATVKRVEQMIEQQNFQSGNFTPPSKADVYQTINQTEVQNLMTRLSGEAKVDFPDPTYAHLSDAFKAAAAENAAAAGGAAPGGGAPGGAPASSGAPAPSAAPSAPPAAKAPAPAKAH